MKDKLADIQVLDEDNGNLSQYLPDQVEIEIGDIGKVVHEGLMAQ